MFVIAVYDISTQTKEGRRRLPKVMKAMRKYLHHTQKSVFEGETTEAKLKALEIEIKGIINDNEDYVVIFRVSNAQNVERKNLGVEFDPNENIL